MPSKVRITVPDITIPANSSIDTTVNVSGLDAAKSHISGNPAWGLGPNLLYNVMITAADTVTIRISNLGSTEATVTSRDWMFMYTL